MNLRSYENFKDLSSLDMKSLRTWYRNRYRGLVKVNKKTTNKVPPIEHPNEILMNLLGDQVEYEHKAYIA